METKNDNSERTQNENTNHNHQDFNAYQMLYGSNTSEELSKEDLLKEFREDNKTNKAKIIVPSVIAVIIVATVVSLIISGKLRIPNHKTQTTTIPYISETYFEETSQTETAELFIKIVFDANGGTAEYRERNGFVGDPFGILPDATREGYEFEGWFTERENGERVLPDTIVTESNPVLYAHWTEVTTTETTTTVPSTTATTAASTKSTMNKTSTAKNVKKNEVKRSNEVLFANEEMIVYSIEGFDIVNMDLLPTEENMCYHSGSTGVIGDNKYYNNLECKQYEGDGGHTARWFAEQFASAIPATSYTKTINGLTFYCVDYDNDYGWHVTVLFYVSNGQLIEIVGSSGARESVWPMLEACVFSR